MDSKDIFFKVKFDTNKVFKPKFDKIESHFKTKVDKTESHFKSKFDKTESHFKTKVDKTESHFKLKVEVTPVEQDIYYDEVIYYDGGNIEGYGYDK